MLDVATPTLTPRKTTARSTTIALKTLMAVTGLLFVLFVVAHMYGNLKILDSRAAFDEYAHHLRVLGEPMLPYGGFLWVFRIVLILAVLGHAYAAFTLWKRNTAARGKSKYVVKKAVKASLASKTMRWGGVALLLFVVFHILHFTANVIRPDGGDYPSPAERYVSSFELWWVALIYLLAMIALSLHLMHGVWSMCATLGWNHTKKSEAIARGVALAIALIVGIGFMLPPLMILFGYSPALS